MYNCIASGSPHDAYNPTFYGFLHGSQMLDDVAAFRFLYLVLGPVIFFNLGSRTPVNVPDIQSTEDSESDTSWLMVR